MSRPTVLVVHNSDSDPVGRVGQWLAEAGVDLQIVDGPDLPADLSGYAGLVVLGGPMGANDDAVAPWLPHERALLREAVRDEVPTLGICLGGQLLAAANGGRVEPDPDGPELGAQLIAKRTGAATDPLFAALPITPDVIQWHYDTITVLPPGAVHLANSPVCEHQAFRLGRVAWGLQFHIETTPDVVAAWAAKDAPRLAGFDLDRIVERAGAIHDDLAEGWAPFVHAFAAVVTDPSTVAPAVPKRANTVSAAIAALGAESSAARTMLPMPAMPAMPPQPRDR